jgi:hypothetical protein
MPQTHAVVRKLQLLLPGIKIWLDVDYLNDLGKLEESVADCAVFLIFLSKGYFRSANCRRELYAAFASRRPIVVIHEVDEVKGGAAIVDLKEECLASCIEEKPDAYPAYSGPEEAVRRVFEHDDPVMWVRAADFQTVSLKAIASRILPHLLYYTKHPTALAAGLKLAGELGPVVVSHPITLLVCNANTGAQAVAEEIRLAAAVVSSSASPIMIEDAANAIASSDDATAVHEHTVLLVYLTKDAFLGDDGVLAHDVQRAIDAEIPLALVHEQEPTRGACAFSILYGQTPDFLLRPPYKIFDIVAVPLYFSLEHRKISLWQVLKYMDGLHQRTDAMHQFGSSSRRMLRQRRTLPLRSTSRRREMAARQHSEEGVAV